jgi:hypothetical protein
MLEPTISSSTVPWDRTDTKSGSVSLEAKLLFRVASTQPLLLPFDSSNYLPRVSDLFLTSLKRVNQHEGS